MSRTYFKATKDVKGAIVNFYHFVSDGEARFVLTTVKQNGWNEQKRVGSFSGGQRLNVTFNLNEIGDIANHLRTRKNPFSFYHSTNNGITSGNITYKERTVGEGDRQKVVGAFTIYLKQDNNIVSSSLTLGEADDLLAYINYCRNQIYSTLDQAEAKERLQRRNNVAAKAREEVEQTPEDAEQETSEVPAEEDGLTF